LTDYLSNDHCVFAVGNPDAAQEQVVACVQRAAELGIKNHNKEKIQTVFDGVINNLESTAS
jgi:hypothetical protein